MTKLRKLLALMLVLTLVVTAATVSATAATTAIAFNKSTNLKLNVGDTNTRTATTTPAGRTVTYTSSRPAVATVNATGGVTCKKVGKTVITATSGKQTASYNLTVVAATSSAAPDAKTSSGSSESSFLAGYPVTVYDKTTVCTNSSGKDYPITTYYFYSSDRKLLGMLTKDTYQKILNDYKGPLPDSDWGVWLTQQFNLYRGLKGGSNILSNIPFTIDTEAAAQELIELANNEREKSGLIALVHDSSLSDLAQTRAVESAEKFSHERPDGSDVTNLGYTENLHLGNTFASDVIESWMNSKGHRAAIMSSDHISVGAGVYQNNMGRVYWVLVFSYE